jgi:hypothetical protein
LSATHDAPKINRKTNRSPTPMFKFRIGSSRMAPQPEASEARFPWAHEDSSWYNSSFELARGLEVIEHCGRPPAIPADPNADFDPRRS